MSRFTTSVPKLNNLAGGTGALYAFYAILVCSAMDSMSLGPIPVMWLGQTGSLIAAIHVGFSQRFYQPLGFRWLILLFLWSALITAINTFYYDYSSLMPANVTTTYSIFITLRLVSMVSFMSTLLLVYWLIVSGYRDSIIKFTVLLGSITSVIAIYVYVAQIYGLPDLPRNRLGTGGEAQATTFTYAFHRAMGPFREPGLLAMWLIVPFSLSIMFRQRATNIYTVTISSALLLTGSLGGLLGIALGFVGAVLTTRSFKSNNSKILVRLTVAISLALLIFYGVAVSNSSEEVNIFRVINDRATPILFEGGMASSNRGYIYDYVANISIPIWGAGLGNSNLLLSDYLKSDLVASFLSLYFSFLFSTGVLGLALVCCFLFRPVIIVYRHKNLHRNKQVVMILTGYVAWLIVFATGYDEFSLMFAIILALLAHEISPYDQSKKAMRHDDVIASANPQHGSFSRRRLPMFRT